MADAFKVKEHNNTIIDNRYTIETKHAEHLKKFENDQEVVLPKKEKELEKLKNKLSSLKNNKEHDQVVIYQYVSNIEDDIRNLTAEIKKLKSKEEEHDYALDTNVVIMKYFSDKEENSLKKVDADNYIDQSTQDPDLGPNVLSFFMNTAPKKEDVNHIVVKNTKIKHDDGDTELFEDERIADDSSNDYQGGNKRDITNFVKVEHRTNKKSDLLKEYIRSAGITDPNHKVAMEGPVVCPNCDKTGNFVELNLYEEVCMSCGLTRTIISEDLEPSYKDLQDIEIVPKFSYQRINHFNEWLNQLQGKESTTIPDFVYDGLKAEIKKYRLSIKDINPSKVRTFLRKLKLHKYYEHIPFIINGLTGKQPPVLTTGIQEKFRYMFMEMQNPFRIHRPKTRKNFLNYCYVLHKFSELLELDHLLCRFPYLINRQNLYEHDQIWRKICKDLKWEFIPSL